MKIFISYSAQDTTLIRQFANGLKKIEGISQVDWWEDSKRLGQEAWPQIRSWIDEADLVLVFVTESALNRAMAIGNEAGHAKAKGKYIIPLLVSKVLWWQWLPQKLGFKVGIRAEDLGCLGDLVHVRINERDPNDGIEKISSELKRLISDKQDSERLKLFLAVLAAIGVIWAGSK